jgi:hypothetical protein
VLDYEALIGCEIWAMGAINKVKRFLERKIDCDLILCVGSTASKEKENEVVYLFKKIQFSVF